MPQEYPGLPTLPLPTIRPQHDQSRESQNNNSPLQSINTNNHYSGTNFPLKWEGGKEKRISHQRSKQEKAWATSLESK